MWILSQNFCMCSDFTKMTPKIKVQTSFFGGHVMFYSVLFGQVRGNLAKKGALIWKNAPNMKRNAVVFLFGGHFLWSIFRASLGKFVQKSFAPPKIYLLLHLCSKVRNWSNYWNCLADWCQITKGWISNTYNLQFLTCAAETIHSLVQRLFCAKSFPNKNSQLGFSLVHTMLRTFRLGIAYCDSTTTGSDVKD